VILNWNGTNETFDNNTGDIFWENKTSLGDGTYTFYAWCNDSATNSNQTAIRSLMLDTTPPVITVIAPTPLNNSVQNSASVEINASVIDSLSAIDTCTLEFNGMNKTMNKTGTGTSVLCNSSETGLGPGWYNFTVYANETTGNTGSNGTWFFTVRRVEVPPGGGSSEQALIYSCNMVAGQSKQFDLRVGDSIDCSIKGELHSIRLAEILDEQKLAEFEVASPFRIALGVGQVYQADIDNNGLNDTKITLLSFAFPNRATIMLSLLNEVTPIIPVAPAPTPAPTPAPAPKPTPPAPSVVPITKAAAPPVLILGLIILLVLVIMTAGYRAYISRRVRLPRRLTAIAIPEMPRPPVAAPARVPAEAIELQQKIAAIREELEKPIPQARPEKPAELFKPKAVAAKPERLVKPTIRPQKVYSALGRVETELKAPVKIPSYVWPKKPAKPISLPKKEVPREAIKKKPVKKTGEKKFYKALGKLEKTLK
jgi:hypothetical protein